MKLLRIIAASVLSMLAFAAMSYAGEANVIVVDVKKIATIPISLVLLSHIRIRDGITTPISGISWHQTVRFSVHAFCIIHM
jgi:hypothetical protein